MTRKAVVIYAGRRLKGGGGYTHLLIDGDQQYGYRRPPAKWALPGQVFEVIFGDQDALLLGGDDAPKLIVQEHQEEAQASQVAEWWALDRVAEIEHGLDQRAKKARTGENELSELLRPLREMFRRANQPRKRLLLAVVIQELLRP